MPRETKFIGWFAIALGCSSLLHAGMLLFGSPSPPQGMNCRAICGLALLTAEVFGASAGTLVEALLSLAVGAAFSRFGYLALRN